MLKQSCVIIHTSFSSHSWKPCFASTQRKQTHTHTSKLLLLTHILLVHTTLFFLHSAASLILQVGCFVAWLATRHVTQCHRLIHTKLIYNPCVFRATWLLFFLLSFCAFLPPTITLNINSFTPPTNAWLRYRRIDLLVFVFVVVTLRSHANIFHRMHELAAATTQTVYAGHFRLVDGDKAMV